MRSSIRGVMVIIVLAMIVPCAVAEKKQFRYSVGKGASVSIVNDLGPVTVRPSSAGQVIITATPSSDKVEVDSNQTGNRVTVRTHFLQHAGVDEGRVEYDVQVPPGVNLTVHAGGGPIRLQGLSGDVALDGDTADIEVRDCSNAHVHARTVSGSVVLSNLSNGYVEATTIGGPVTLTSVTGSRVSVNTTSGAIASRGDFAGGGEYSLTSHSGNIEVALPGSASVEVSAHTVSGTVENDFPLAPLAHPAFTLTQGKSFAGTANQGASSIRLQTFSGKIRVKKQ